MSWRTMLLTFPRGTLARSRAAGGLSRFFPTTSLGIYLMAMAALTILPFLGFVVFLLVQLENGERATLRRETAQDAQVIGRSVERRLQEMATTLRLLSTSPELKSGDLVAFQDRTASSLRASSLYLLLVDRQGEQLMNTRVPPGKPLQRMSNVPALQSALSSGQIEVSDIFFGATSQRWVFNVTTPLTRDQSPNAAAMILAQDAGDLSSMTATDALPPGWSAAIIDANGDVVVSSGPDNQPSGTPFPKEMVDVMTGGNDSAVVPESDPQTLVGYYRIPGWSWRTVTWGPISSAQETLMSTWRRLFFGSSILLVLSLLVAWAVAQQLRRSVRQITAMAEQIGEGEIVSPVVTKITEANQVAIALSNASFDRRQAEDRVHLVLNELVHRTTNILTLVQSMMRQISRKSSNMEEFQAAIGGRLSGLARSIEALAREQWVGIPLSQLVNLQLSTVAGSCDRVTLVGRDFTLNTQAVQNLGLVFYELGTNSVKYGALSTPSGRILVKWHIAEGDLGPMLEICWAESGGPPVEEPHRHGFGTTIIERHAASAFGGKVELHYRRDGMTWILKAPFRAFEIENDQSGH